MRTLRSVPLCILAILLSVAAAKPQAAPAVRIVNPIDEKQLVTIKGTVHPLANARNDRGAAPDEMPLDRMHLVLKRSSSQEAALQSLIADLHTKGNASYHKWLTPEAFGRQFGPADADVTTVENWLSGHGFTVTKVNPGKQTIEFSGNVAQFRTAFHAQIHKYQVNGETHYANSSDPQIPAALSSVVGGFVALNNFPLKSYAKYLGKAQYNPRQDKAIPEWTVGSGNSDSFVLAPVDYAVQYDLAPLYTAGTNGSGQTIAIINESNINVGLVNSFRSLFSLPFNPPQVIIDGSDPGVDGVNNPDGPNGASVEAYLDVEWAGAVAPNATIDLVVGADTALQSGLFLAAERAVYSNIAPVISMSFGNCEANIGTFNAFMNSLWEQAAAQGITVMVSSGDSGSAGCDDDDTQYYAIKGLGVNGLGSTPYNVSVGGTDFYYSDYNNSAAIGTQLDTYWNTTTSNNVPAVSIKGVIPEQPWNDSQYGLNINSYYSTSNPVTSIAGGSGGASTVYTTKPAWQTGFGGATRDLPDVSLFASNGINASYYPICAIDGDCQPVSSGDTVQISGVGGTSASSPSFAGIMALVNQKYGRQGQADFVLYPLSKQFPASFNDVAHGTNTVPCSYSATVSSDSPNCIAVSDPLTVTDPTNGSAEEGEIGTGTTADYNAVAGYDLASGLGTIDANQLVTNWGSVKFAASTTTLTPSSTSFAHGAAITVSGTVTAASGTPGGDVALMTDNLQEGQQGIANYPLTSGAYSGSVTTLPGGTYNIWGQYGGDTANAASTSTPVSITVTPESSGIFLALRSAAGNTYTATSAPGASVDYGTQLEVSARVAPSSALTALETCTTSCPTFTDPTGSVAFSDNATPLSTALINAEGDAEYNAPFGVGAHSVTASYAGDSSYNASTASAITFTVVQDTPTLYLGAANQTNDTTLIQVVGGTGQPTALNVLVENGAQVAVNPTIAPVPVAAPTGTVTVTGFPSGTPTTGTLSAGVDPSTGAVAGIATIVVPATTAAGTYNVSLSYAGDKNYSAIPAETGQVQIVANGLKPTTTTAALSGTISPTTSVTITGTVTGAGTVAPTGDVYVYTSGTFMGGAAIVPATGDVSNFTIILNSQSLIQGANLITLEYYGDTNYNPSAYVLPNAIANPLSDFSLIPATTNLPINISAGAASATDTINLSSINGFSGPVTLTCSAAPGVTCSITPAAPSLTGGGTGTATLTIDANQFAPDLNYNVAITGTDSTGAYVHTTGVEAVITGSTVTSSFALSAIPGTLSLATGATTGNTATFTVTPLGPFTGVVALSCAATDSTGTAVAGLCALAAPSVTGSGTDVVTIATTSATAAGTYTVTVTGVSGAITQTASVALTVTAPVAASYAMANSGAISVTRTTAGGSTSGTSTISVTPSGGFTGTVALTCAITPVAASDPATCSLSKASLTGFTGSTAQTSTLTVTVTNESTTTSQNQVKKLFWPSTGGAALALAVFFGLPKRRRNWLAMFSLLVVFVTAAGLGCGGGGGSSGGGGGGTPGGGTTAGAYTVTITGTSGSATQTTTVALTVN